MNKFLFKTAGNFFSYMVCEMPFLMVVITGLTMIVGVPLHENSTAVFHLINEFTSQVTLTNQDAGELYESN